MKWNTAYAILLDGGMVRLPSWEKEEFIVINDDEEVPYITNQNEEYIELIDSELRSDEWEEVLPPMRPDSEVSDECLLERIKARYLAKLNYKTRILISRLRFCAEHRNSLLSWNIGEAKYYIEWDEIEKDFTIKSTVDAYICGVIFFKSRVDCNVAINVNRWLLEQVRDLDMQYNWLCNHTYSREELEEINLKLESFK